MLANAKKLSQSKFASLGAKNHSPAADRNAASLFSCAGENEPSNATPNDATPEIFSDFPSRFSVKNDFGTLI